MKWVPLKKQLKQLKLKHFGESNFRLKSCNIMTYGITTKAAPAMPKLGKGLDFVKLVLSQMSPDMREPIVPTLFDAAATHISATDFLYPELSWRELCGMIDALSAGSTGGKCQLQGYVEAMMRFARKHDEVELQKRSFPEHQRF